MIDGSSDAVFKPVSFFRLNFCCFLLTASDGLLVETLVILNHLPRIVDQMRRQI